ncbi:MAG: lipopolysaccharide biosynthesis protein [Phycisphaeraceae bacterium JB051]
MRTALLTSRYALGMLIQQALLYILVPIYTAYLTPAELGSWFLLLTTTALVGDLTKSPVASAISRFYFHPKYIEKQNALADTLLLWYLVMTFIVMGLYYLSAKPITTLIFDDTALLGPTRTSTLIIFTFGASVLLMNYMRLLEMAWGFLLVSVLQAIVTTATALTLLIAYDMGIYALIYGYAAGQSLQILAALVIVRQRWLPVLDFKLIRTPLKFGFLSLPSSYGSSLIQTGDRYVINALMSTAMVGVYSFGSLIANIITMLFTRPMIMGTAPIIRKLESKPDEQKRVISSIFLYSSWLGCAMAIGISCLAQPLVQLLAQSEAYYGAWIVIPPLALARVLHTLTDTAGTGLYFGNRPGIISAITVGAGCLNVALNFLLIPVMGLSGAAVATLITMLVWNGFYCWLSYRLYELSLPIMRVVSSMMIAVLLFAVTLLFQESNGLLIRLLIAIALCLSYPIILSIFGILNAQERAATKAFFQQIRALGITHAARQFFTR